MPLIDDLLERNRAYAAASGGQHLEAAPRLRLAVVACMDARIDVLAVLGLEVGDAHVIRNAGGVISEDAIRSLAISQRRLGTEEIVLIHHTGCGMTTLTDDEFRAELEADTGMAPPFAIESFRDPEADVRQSLLRVRRSPFLLHRDRARGFVLDIETHLLREVEAPA
jgi:carbonic anhydrase